MKLKRGSTSIRRLIFIGDSSSTTGAGLASLVYNSAGLVAYYFAGDLSDEVQITLVSGTLGTFTSGGFVAVDNSNMPGWYEIGIPNAALDGGNEVCIQLRGATNMVPVNIYIELDAVDYQNATDFGLSRLDAAISSRSTLDAAGVRTAVGLASANLDAQLGGLDNTLASVDSATSNIQAKTDQLQFDGDGYLFVDLVSLNSDPLLVGKLAAFADGGVESSGFVNVASLAADSIGSGELAASAITEIQSGLATTSDLATVAAYIDTEVAAIKAKTDTIPSWPANFASLAITVGGAVTAGTVSDKTGYSLSQSFPANFSALGINASGHINRVVLTDTCTTNTDMRGTNNAMLAASYTAPDNTGIAAIKVTTDKVATMLVQDGLVWQFTTNALELGPSGGGGGGGDATLANQEEILSLLQSGDAIVRTPVATNGKLTGPIIIGDSYQSENARAFTWLINPVSGVNVATVTCKFGAIAGVCADKQFIVDGTVEAVTVDGDPKWKLIAELDPEDTANLPEDKYRWSVSLVYSDGSQETRYYGDEWLKIAATR